MTRSVLFMVLLAGAASCLHAQQLRPCGTRTDLPASSDLAAAPAEAGETGGRYLTGCGTLRVLLVFASFPDDERPHPYWPAHQPPLFMEQFLDADTATHSRGPFNLTNYFRQMSVGQFQVIGDAIWLESAHPESTYANGSFARANIGLLIEKVDPVVDLSLYDQWSQEGEFRSVRAPDGQVDMIIMVWRTEVFPFIGEASLGYRPPITLDGVRIETGYPGSAQFPLGSGITCEFPFRDTPQLLMRTIVHELGHWLLGPGHPYNDATLPGKHDYWGMICSPDRRSSCANTYERARLGWIRPDEPPADDALLLPDFITSGKAVRYHPPNGEPEEYIYLENHQRLSVFDDVTLNTDERGIWMLHQQGPYQNLDNLRIKPSDGLWEWLTPGLSSSAATPIFARGAPLPARGSSHRDMLTTSFSDVEWMRNWMDPLGEVHHGLFSAGELFSGALTESTMAVFSSCSNPSSCTWDLQPAGLAFEVTGQRGDTCRLLFATDPATLSPARRHIGWNPQRAHTSEGQVCLAWGAAWIDGQPLEADVDRSELQVSIGEGWLPVYAGPATSYDGTVPDSTGTMLVRYRVRVRDTQGNFSTWSDPYIAVPRRPVSAPYSAVSMLPKETLLGANFPNPFNPSTTIPFMLRAAGFIHLYVVDLLGREVTTLLEGFFQAGSHAIQWNGKDRHGHQVSSGVYFVRLVSPSGASVKPLLLSR